MNLPENKICNHLTPCIHAFYSVENGQTTRQEARRQDNLRRGVELLATGRYMHMAPRRTVSLWAQRAPRPETILLTRGLHNHVTTMEYDTREEGYKGGSIAESGNNFFINKSIDSPVIIQ